VKDVKLIDARALVPKANVAEALLVGFAAVGAVSMSFAIAPGWAGAAGAGLAIQALAIAIVDRRAFIIPDGLNAAAFMLGVLVLGLGGDGSQALACGLLRAAVMFGAFFVFRVGYRKWRGREGMGFGDVKLAAVAGVWLNWFFLPIVVDIAALAALAAVLIGRAAGKKLTATAKLPFGLFFAPAIWLCWALALWQGG
jgi:leader peptidase (prepilin peptidase) / N-methyltransferase